MLKKLMLPILIISIVVQLLVPVGMIAYGNKAEDDLQKYGKEFKLRVYVQSVYNGHIDINFYEYDLFRIGHYAILEEDEDGFANLGQVQGTKPKTPDYIYITSENKQRLGEDFSINSDVTSFRVGEKSAYLVVKVYNGDFEIVDLYMDDMCAEEWFKNTTIEKDQYGEDILKYNLE